MQQKLELAPLSHEFSVIINIPNIEPSTTRPTELDTDKVVLECPICLDNYPKSNIIIVPECQHGFCLSCLKEYLINQTQSLKVLKINCPQSGCENLLPDKLIKQVLDVNHYDKYKKLVLQKVANRDLKNKFCPKPGCSKSFIPAKQQEHTICECGTQICNTCVSFWHQGKSCLEALDLDFELFSKENEIKFCVMCKTVVKKEEGCSQITCPICDFQWCWTCGRAYSSHKCPGYWSPFPSRIVSKKPAFFSKSAWKNVWRKSSKSKKLFIVITGIFLSPLILLGMILLWPIILDDNIELSAENPISSFCVILFALMVGILTLPVTLFCIAVYILFSPILLLVWMFESSPPPRPPIAEIKPTTRWSTGNANLFKYTNSSVPSINQRDLNIRIIDVTRVGVERRNSKMTQNDKENNKINKSPSTQPMINIMNNKSSSSQQINYKTIEIKKEKENHTVKQAKRSSKNRIRKRSQDINNSFCLEKLFEPEQTLSKNFGLKRSRNKSFEEEKKKQTNSFDFKNDFLSFGIQKKNKRPASLPKKRANNKQINFNKVKKNMRKSDSRIGSAKSAKNKHENVYKDFGIATLFEAEPNPSENKILRNEAADENSKILICQDIKDQPAAIKETKKDLSKKHAESFSCKQKSKRIKQINKSFGLVDLFESEQSLTKNSNSKMIPNSSSLRLEMQEKTIKTIVLLKSQKNETNIPKIKKDNKKPRYKGELKINRRNKSENSSKNYQDLGLASLFELEQKPLEKKL